ncbi:1-deoxy-D-xylulose-5-phosphate synthase [Leclercia adecarboxylata]|uniref:1-deoxy-D-xylulose-5-phosphate synthase n=1 Tax=Leclercia adecarboxylata TaxID=83655 RepID=A0A4U9HQ19_9ENTR|nr:1-deoxy-D-xylulose-5-phosphate synthase [Leclercia adecarboxylata]
MSFDIAKYPTLALVDSTQELRLLPKENLPKLCDELRRYLLDSVSRSSGQFRLRAWHGGTHRGAALCL